MPLFVGASVDDVSLPGDVCLPMEILDSADLRYTGGRLARSRNYDVDVQPTGPHVILITDEDADMTRTRTDRTVPRIRTAYSSVHEYWSNERALDDASGPTEANRMDHTAGSDQMWLQHCRMRALPKLI